jgi:hypothetical protein
MFVVRGGRIVWQDIDGSGNVLFAHQYGVTLSGPDTSVPWRVDAPPNTELHSA